MNATDFNNPDPRSIAVQMGLSPERSAQLALEVKKLFGRYDNPGSALIDLLERTDLSIKERLVIAFIAGMLAQEILHREGRSML